MFGLKGELTRKAKSCLGDGGVSVKGGVPPDVKSTLFALGTKEEVITMESRKRGSRRTAFCGIFRRT
jgi:hypothetical protein